MKWSEYVSNAVTPDMELISEFIANPLWDEFCRHIEADYCVTPNLQYSVCSGAPGWNVKYRKGGRALCTLYPDDGFFTCLVTVGNREAAEAELLMPLLSDNIRRLYQNAKPINGARWLMISVNTTQSMEDAKRLIALRVQKKTYEFL